MTWINLTNGNTRSIQFGSSLDQFVLVDFDGEGISDVTLWRPSKGNWYWIHSSDSVFQGMHSGLQNDTPVPAVYDGDWKTDQAVNRRGSPNSVITLMKAKLNFALSHREFQAIHG